MIFSRIPYLLHPGYHRETIFPLLFLLYINNISSVLKHTKILLFADDAKIFKTIHSVSDALALQFDFDVFSVWCTKNGMELNINKCSIISFSQKKKHFGL